MSTVVNKQTMQILRSAHTPDYDSADWLINPEFPECEIKYMKVDNGLIVEMSAGEKKAVDNAAAASVQEGLKAGLISIKLNEMGEAELINDGVLDADGNITGG